MKVLLLNQCFWPDVVATSQQLTALARALAERGHHVTVIAGRRGYDDPQMRFPRRERWEEIEIVRLPTIALGKTRRWRRFLTFGSFYVECALRLAITSRHDVVVSLTSPPLISWLASMFTRIRGGRSISWVMDLNPDEAIAAGWLRKDSIAAKLLGSLLESSMHQADKIVVLDRLMKDRFIAKRIAEMKIMVIPPFTDDAVKYDAEGRAAFRRAHNLAGKFVVMHAGNHSPCHRLDTLLEAACQLREQKNIVFCFVGGGSEFRRVGEYAEDNRLQNTLCLPYQPQVELSALLSAADLHTVVMGDAFPGIIHPSKIYNILATGLPFLYIGPTDSHMGDIVAKLSGSRIARQALHGEVDKVARYIVSCMESLEEAPEARVATALAQQFSKATLLPKLINEIEVGESRAIPQPAVTELAQTIPD